MVHFTGLNVLKSTNHISHNEKGACPLTRCGDAVESNESIEARRSSSHCSCNAIWKKTTHSILTCYIGCGAQVSEQGE